MSPALLLRGRRCRTIARRSSCPPPRSGSCLATAHLPSPPLQARLERPVAPALALRWLLCAEAPASSAHVPKHGNPEKPTQQCNAMPLDGQSFAGEPRTSGLDPNLG